MNILIVKTSALGDIIHALPVVDYLKESLPNVSIDWVVERPFLEVIQNHPSINTIYTIESKQWRKSFFRQRKWKKILLFVKHLRQKKYDLIVDLQGNVKSGIVTACAKAQHKVGFGFKTLPEWPNGLVTNQRYNPPAGKNIREDYLFLAQSALYLITQKTSSFDIRSNLDNNHIEKPAYKNVSAKILVCIGSNWANKQLSVDTLKHFLQLINESLSGQFFFIWGNAEEKTKVNQFSEYFENACVCDKMTIPLLKDLMEQMDLVIAMDSLPLHLAGTTSTPTYSIFGASSAHKYKPLGLMHQAFQGKCPYGQQFEKRCPLLRTCKTGACIKDIDSKELFNDFNQWWQSSK